MNTPFSGFHYFLSGFELLAKSGVKRYVIIPVLINILLFVGLFFVFEHYIHIFANWFTKFLPIWLEWLVIVVWIFFIFAFFLIFIYTFVTISNLIAAPFNSLLAEKVELYLTGSLATEMTFGQTLKDLPRIIGRQLSILGYYLPRALLLLIIFFVPIIQLVAAPLWFIFNAWFMSMTFLDYPTDNHRIPIKDVRRWQSDHSWLCLGFGGSVVFASMIPFVNFFTVPAAVAGATKLWLEENAQNRSTLNLANPS